MTTGLIDNTVVVNANFNLTCCAQANPTAKYRFYREQGSLFNTTTGRNVAVYTVSVSERINEVKFSCTPVNDFGDGTTKTITVIVYCKYNSTIVNNNNINNNNIPLPRTVYFISRQCLSRTEQAANGRGCLIRVKGF